MVWKNKYSAIALLILIILAGGFLRFYHLGHESIWLDEAISLHNADRGSVAEVIRNLDTPPKATQPLYSAAMQAWIGVFGKSESSLRFPSALFGTLAIPLIYLVGWRLSGKKAGLIAALMLSLSMVQVVYSQEMRSYSLFVFTSVLSTYLFIRLLDKGLRLLPALAFMASCAMMIYSHYLGMIMVFLFHLAFYLVSKRKAGRWNAIMIGINLIFLPAYLLLMDQFQEIAFSFSTYLTRAGLGALAFNTSLYLVLLTVFISAQAAIPFILRSKNSERIVSRKTWKKSWMRVSPRVLERAFLAFCGVLFLAGIAAAPRLTMPLFLTRYTIYLFPPFYLLMAFMFITLKDRKIKGAIIVMFIISSSFALYQYHMDVPRKPQWREAAEYLGAHLEAEDKVLVVNGFYIMPLDYYLAASNQRIPIEPPASQDRLEAQLEGIPGRGATWVIIRSNFRNTADYESMFSTVLGPGEKEEFKDILILRFE